MISGRAVRFLKREINSKKNEEAINKLKCSINLKEKYDLKIDENSEVKSNDDSDL